jgi:nicotinamide riboside transporter PnuC
MSIQTILIRKLKMENIFFIIAGFISVVFGIKRPKVGLVIGVIVVCTFYYLTQTFEIRSLLTSLAIGIPVCALGSFLTSWIFSGFRGGDHNTGPSYKGGFGRGGAPPGGIIRSDEEIESHK